MIIKLRMIKFIIDIKYISKIMIIKLNCIYYFVLNFIQFYIVLMKQDILIRENYLCIYLGF